MTTFETSFLDQASQILEENMEKSLSQTEFLVQKLRQAQQQIETQQSKLELDRSIVGQLQSEILEAAPPKPIIDSNWLTKIPNHFKYKQERKKFEQQFQEYLQAGLVVKSDSTSLWMEDLTEQARQIQTGDTWLRVYYLAGLPDRLLPGIIFPLLNSGLPLRISYFVKDTSKGALLKACRQRQAVLEANQQARLDQQKNREPESDKEISELTSFIDDLVYERERAMQVTVYVALQANSQTELIAQAEQLNQITADLEITFNTYTFGQKKALPGLLPLASNPTRESKLLPSSAAFNLLPFLSRQFSDPKGIWLGQNQSNRSLIMLDLFQARNANLNIFGTSGSGKSVTAKLLINRFLLQGIQTLVIDPEGEYRELAQAVQGQVFTFRPGNGLNPFSLGTEPQQISLLKTFFRFFISDSRYDDAALDQALCRYCQNPQPNLPDFLKFCQQQDLPLALDLAKLVHGSLAGIFTAKTTPTSQQPLLVFDLSELQTDELKQPAMFLIATLIWQRLKTDSCRKMVLIDEAHKLLINQSSTNFYVDLVKTARKRQAGVISITQNPEDFRLQNGAKAILTQAETSILLKQSFASLKYLQEESLFPLTHRELLSLPGLNIGQALLLREKERVWLQVRPLRHEQAIVFNN